MVVVVVLVVIVVAVEGSSVVCAAFVHPTICVTFVHMNVRVMLVICWGVLAALFVNNATLLDLRSRGLSTANVESCCVISFHRAMGELVNQWAVCHPLRRFALQPSGGQELNTVKVNFLHDFSPPAVTESQRARYAIHLDDSVWLLIFHIAKNSRSPSQIYVRVTLVISWLFAARSVDVAGLWNFSDTWLEHHEGGSPPRRQPLLCHGGASQAVRHSPAARSQHLHLSPTRRPCVLDSAVP